MAGRNGGFSVSMMLDYDRGYATGSLHFYKDEALDVEKAAAFLCSDCLNRILPYDLNQCFGVGAINLTTKEIRVFERSIIGFGLGDFHFDCYLMDEQKHNSDWMDADFLLSNTIRKMSTDRDSPFLFILLKFFDIIVEIHRKQI